MHATKTKQTVQVSLYASLESLRQSVDRALADITGEPTKEQVINVLARMEKYLIKAEQVARYVSAHNLLYRSVVRAIVRERCDISELISIARRRPDLIGVWNRDKLERLVDGIAGQVNEVIR